jgi:hypothetical protein|tara:strand:- start:4004 stop:4186 length:183 start_codon:yes stop_codon:yes gene_type:complete
MLWSAGELQEIGFRSLRFPGESRDPWGLPDARALLSMLLDPGFRRGSDWGGRQAFPLKSE